MATTASAPHKRCPHCKVTKLYIYFAKSKNRKDGHSGWCKQCLKRNSKKWRGTDG